MPLVFLPPENIKKPDDFFYLRGVYTEFKDTKWIEQK